MENPVVQTAVVNSSIPVGVSTFIGSPASVASPIFFAPVLSFTPVMFFTPVCARMSDYFSHYSALSSSIAQLQFCCQVQWLDESRSRLLYGQ